FAFYLVACLLAYAVPSAVGANVARLRYAALPIILLVLALRRWRPLSVSLVVAALVSSWSFAQIGLDVARSAQDTSASQAYWQPAIAFLRRALTPSYRVEAVDTTAHWEAYFLPRAGIPLARGWFRQDDFPQNAVLYGPLGRRIYLAWLHHLAVRYVVLTDSASDYSAVAEARLLRSGRSGLTPVFHSRHLVVYSVPSPRPIIRGRSPARVLQMTPAGLRLKVARPGTYHLAVRYSSYWSSPTSCVQPASDGMTQLKVFRAG